MDESSPILVREQNGILRLAWDNRRVRKDNFILGFVFLLPIFCAALAVTAAYAILRPEGFEGDRIAFVICCCLGLVGAFLIPLIVIIPRTWSESIQISSFAVTYGSSGFLAPKPRRYPMRAIIEIGCGRCHRTGGEQPEFNITLNIWLLSETLALPKRRMFGYWLAPELKVQVFETIEEFVARNQIPLKLTRYSTSLPTGSEMP
jgi:hypothetical protein